MDFRTIETMVAELEKKQAEYNKVIELKIVELKAEIEKLKDEYRKETRPEVKGVADYLLDKAKKYFDGYFFEANEATEQVDDFYYLMDRKIDKNKVIMVMIFHKGMDYYSSIFKEYNANRFVLVFTDQSLYIYSEYEGVFETLRREIQNKIDYKAITEIAADERFNFEIKIKDESGSIYRYSDLSEIIKYGFLLANDSCFKEKKHDDLIKVKNETMVRFMTDIMDFEMRV